MFPEMTFVVAVVRVQACIVRADEEWVYLARWALSWIHDGSREARNRSSETQADLGTECPLPSAVQQDAAALPFRILSQALLCQPTSGARWPPPLAVRLQQGRQSGAAK